MIFFGSRTLFWKSGCPPPIQLAPGLAVKPEAWKMRGKRWFIIQPVTTSLKTFNFSLGAKKFYRLLCLWVCPLGSDTVLEQGFCLVEPLVFCSRCVFIHDLKKKRFLNWPYTYLLNTVPFKENIKTTTPPRRNAAVRQLWEARTPSLSMLITNPWLNPLLTINPSFHACLTISFLNLYLLLRWEFI